MVHEFHLVRPSDQDREYFCRGCGQLRLWIYTPTPLTKCRNCGSTNILIAPLGTIDKDAELKRLRDAISQNAKQL